MSEKKIFNFQKNKVFIIAEIGFNHEGCYKKCIELIKLASKSGADAIKLQVFNPELNFAKKTESYRVISPASMSHKDLEKVFKFAYKNKIGDYKLGYLDHKSKNENIVISDKETLICSQR